MPVVPVSDWVPDAADLENPGSIQIKNALPGVNSYQPVPELTAITDALGARPTGAIEALDASSNVYQYAGDVDTLYSLTGTAWGDVSIGGGYSTGSGERWEFVRWKEKVLATNFSDNPQQIAFGGTAFSNLTTALKMRHLAVVGEFVVAGNTYDATDGTVRDRVRWSALGDETDWTVAASTQSDYRDLRNGGGVQKIIGGEYGVVVSERSTYRMTYVGSPTVFQIDEVLPGIGATCSGSVVNWGDEVYFISEQGFVALKGGAVVSFPGAGKVDKFILADLDQNHCGRVSAVVDPTGGGRIFWAYPGSGHTDGRPNKIICYDRTLNKWSLIEKELELLWRSGGIGKTLDQLDTVSASIDALGVSLDSSQWKGGAPQFSAFDTDFKNGNFTGAAMTAVVTTKEAELYPGFRTQLNAFRPLVDGGTVTARVASRSRQTDEESYTASLTQSDSGRFTVRSNARYHRFELTASGTWDDIIGVQIEPRDARKAEGR